MANIYIHRKLLGNPHIKPFIVAIWCGEAKPSSVNSFFSSFVAEYQNLFTDGININGHLIRIKIRCFICDTPARSFVKGSLLMVQQFYIDAIFNQSFSLFTITLLGIVNFNHYFGCQKCLIRGTYFNEFKVMSYPKIDVPRRTDENFRSREQAEHHVTRSVLEDLPEVDMVADIPTSDPLHLLDLGIMKRCLFRWKCGTRNYRNFFKDATLNHINQLLLQANKNRPSEIHRSIRTFEYLNDWKGSEFRTFLLYVGKVVLKDYLTDDEYKHFLVLSCSTILCSSNTYRSHVFGTSTSKCLVEALLDNYIEGYIYLYGEHSISSNVHNLCHIVDDVRRFGELSSIDAYPFENTLGLIKQKLKTGNKPLEQISRRIYEINSVLTNESKIHGPKKSVVPVLQFSTKIDQMKVFKTIRFENFCLSTRKFGDKWFQLNDGRVIEFCYAFKFRAEIIISGYEVKDLEFFFSEPFSSSHIDIFIADGERGRKIQCVQPDIKCKNICLKYRDRLTFQPLLHTLK